MAGPWDVISPPTQGAASQPQSGGWNVVSAPGGSQAVAAAQPTTTQKWLASPGGRLLRSDIIDPAIGLAAMVPKAMSTALIGSSPPPLSNFIDTQAKAAQGAADAPFEQANAAMRNTPGYQQARMQEDQITAKNPVGFQRSLLPDTLAAVRGAVSYPFGGSDAASAAMDSEAASQAQYAQAHPVLSRAANIMGGLLAAPDASGMSVAQATAVAPTTEALRNAKNAAYAQAKASGLLFHPSAIDSLAQRIEGQLKASGYRQSLQSPAFTALGELKDAAQSGAPQSLQDMDGIRRVANAATDSADKSTRSAGWLFKTQLDDFVANAQPGDLIGNPDPAAISALQNARELNTRLSKAELIDEEMRKAANSAGNFSGSGFENALRRRFTNLANNTSKWSRFSPDEQAAIQQVVNGDSATNILRYFGKLAPTGIISMGIGSKMGASVGGALAGAPGAAIGAAAVPAVGAISRRLATLRRVGSADAVSSLVRNGGPLPQAAISGAPSLNAASLLPLFAASRAATAPAPASANAATVPMTLGPQAFAPYQ